MKFLIIGLLILNLLILILLFFKKPPQTDSGEFTKLLAAETERLIRIEATLEKLESKLTAEFSANRKEITANLSKHRQEISENLTASRQELATNLSANRKELSTNLQQVQKTLDTRVKTLQDENAKKLEEMRETVDEKLKSSVEKRFNESFKQISNQLTQVYQGLGEMKNLATGVGDLKKVMEGVKTRGIYGEVQLKNIITDMLATSQYAENVATKKGTNDHVEFAIKLPGDQSPVLLPIDSKFPIENYERLLAAYKTGDKNMIEKFTKALSLDVKEQAKKISTKYIDPPETTDFAMMFVPTESLYAEILRIPGLTEEIRQLYHVTIASPSTLPVTLSGLLMGFRTIAIEKRSSEIWQTLGAIKTQFSKFGDLLAATKKKLEETAHKIGSAETTSRQIERKLKNIEALPETDSIKLIGDINLKDKS